jgi:probable RNA-binding protein EIF1AD
MSHRTKQRVYAVFDEASTPPNALTSTQTIARVIKPGGNGCYVCALPDKQTILAELPSRFNSTVWFKPGNYVVVDTKDAMLKGSKIGGEILNIVRDEHAWRKESYW